MNAIQFFNPVRQMISIRRWFFLLLAMLSLAVSPAFGQMSDGQHYFENDKIRLELTIAENGWKITKASVTNLAGMFA